MARKERDYRNNFSAGVVSKEYLAASGRELTQQALKTGKNSFLMNSRNMARRPGSDRLFRDVPFDGRVYIYQREDGALRHLNFSDGLVRIYEEDGTQEASLSGPWGADDIFTMSITDADEQIVICSNSFYPQSLTYDGSWAIDDFAFREDSDGQRAALFVGSGILGLAGVTMQPSAYSGSVTLTFSDDVLVAGHGDVYFMYMRNQIRIDVVNSPTSAAATIIDPLYPTVRVTISGASNYKVGDIVEGDVTNVEGQVVAIGAGTIDVILTEGYSLFQASTADVPGERLVSGEAEYEITSQTTLGSPAATNYWLEEAISDARGYPSTAVIHQMRLCFAGFPAEPSMLACSAIGAENDFDLGGGGDANAIQVFMGRDPKAKIRHLVSTESLVLLTNRGPWYVPEGAEGRFTPSGIEFLPISPDAASTVPPIWTPEGIVFLDSEYRALVLSQTGTRNAAWAVTDISQLGGELISAPKQVTYSSGIGGRRERVVIVLNGDGTAAVFTYRRGGDQAGWTPWERRGDDAYISFASHNGDVYCLATADGKRAYERFRFGAVLDSEFDASSTDYADEDVHMLLNSHVVGVNSTDGGGALGDIGEYDHIDRLGQDFEVIIEPAPYVNANAGRQKRRVPRSWVDVINSGTFRLNGKLCQGYVYSSDPEAPPPVVDKVYRGGQVGSSEDRTIKIEQRDGEGAPLHIRSITMRQSLR